MLIAIAIAEEIKGLRRIALKVLQVQENVDSSILASQFYMTLARSFSAFLRNFLQKLKKTQMLNAIYSNPWISPTMAMAMLS